MSEFIKIHVAITEKVLRLCHGSWNYPTRTHLVEETGPRYH